MKVLSFVVLALATAAASAAVNVNTFVELEARVAALTEPSPAEELLADVRKGMSWLREQEVIAVFVQRRSPHECETCTLTGTTSALVFI